MEEELANRRVEAGLIGPPALFHPTRQPDPSGDFVTVHESDTEWDGVIVPAGTPVLHCHEHQFEAFHYEDIHDVTYRVLLILAGWQSGKSSVGDWWLVREMQKCGPGNYLAAAPSFKLLDKYPMRAISSHLGGILGLGEVIGGAMGEFRVSEGGHRRLWPQAKWPTYNPHDPSRIIFGHADNPDSLASFTGKAAWLDEPGQARFKTESYEEIRGRLGATGGRMLLTTRPYVFNWVKTEIHDRAARNQKTRRQNAELAAAGEPPLPLMPADAGFEMVHFESIDNPRFSREEWEQAKLTMPGWKFNMKYRGRFTRPAGAVYDCWKGWQGVNEDGVVGHVVPAFEPDPKWPRYVGLDFGSPNFAAVFIAEELDDKGQKTGRLCVYKEYAPEESRKIKDHIGALKHGERGLPVAAVGGSKSEGNWRTQFAVDGYPVHPPDQPDVEVGIGRVYAAIQTDQLFVTANCARLIDDLNTYSREVDEAGNVLNDLMDKETYHRADALRYVVGWLKQAGVNLFFRVVNTR